MENEYISRQKVVASIGRVISDMKKKADGDPVQIAAIALVEKTRDYIGKFPADDAAPVRHGYWFDRGSLSCRCSECGCKSTEESPYCHICGAKMDAKRGENSETGKCGRGTDLSEQGRLRTDQADAD